MKAYNTLSTALSMAVNDYGHPDTWACDDDKPLEFFETYTKPYLKISSTKSINEIYPNNTPIYALTGDEFPGAVEILQNEAPDSYVLADGTTLFVLDVYCDEHAGDYMVDTNGSKGPNTFGRDIFTVRYGTVYYDKPKYRIYSGIRDEDDLLETCCQTSGTCGREDLPQGTSCLEKLLKEGKMNY